MHAITDADFDLGQGGFWVTDTGDIHHVHDYAEHYETLHRLDLNWRDDEGYGHVGYTEAYKHGWVRISTYRGHANSAHGRSIAVNFHTKHVTVVALQQAAKIIRHAQLAAWEVYEFANEATEHYAHLTSEERRANYQRFRGNDNGQDKLARLIMGHAMRRNVELKRAAEQAEFDAAITRQPEPEWQYVPTTDPRILEGELVHKLLASIDAAIARELTPAEMAQ